MNMEIMEEYLSQSNSGYCSDYNCHADYSDYMDGDDVDIHSDFDVDDPY